MKIHNQEYQLLIGLGNPGKSYQNNRHNAGFLWIDFLLEKFSQQNFSITSKITKEYQLWEISEKNLYLFKPLLFMNNSGIAVKKYLAYQEKIQTVVLAHDDLDLELSQYKFSPKSPRAHNGVNSIEQTLPNLTMLHLRIGVDTRAGLRNEAGKDYLLKNFTPTEMPLLQNTFEKIWEEINTNS
ncbi:MAG: aminoacyl-tRNA hydrolase [bacterium]